MRQAQPSVLSQPLIAQIVASRRVVFKIMLTVLLDDDPIKTRYAVSLALSTVIGCVDGSSTDPLPRGQRNHPSSQAGCNLDQDHERKLTAVSYQLLGIPQSLAGVLFTWTSSSL